MSSTQTDGLEERPHSRYRAVWTWNVIATAIIVAGMYFVFPRLTQQIVFNGLLRHGWYIIPLVLLVAYAAPTAWEFFKEVKDLPEDDVKGLARTITRKRRRLVFSVFFFVMYIGYATTLSKTTDWLTYKMYAQGAIKLDRLIPADPKFLRFTPLYNACVDMANAVKTTGEELQCKYTFGFMTPHGFGYASPLQPTGVYNTFMQPNSGYMVLDDSAAAADDPHMRIKRVHLPQKYGVGVEWRTNLESYVLPHVDFFASYEKPHSLVLDPSKPDEITAVVPKIKYGWLWQLRHWGGVVLVHSNGTIEDLSPEQAMADPRLKGKWIYPLELAKYYVELQNYALGYGPFSDWFYFPGQLKVEQLSGKNQYPFLTQAADATTYHVTSTVGKGQAIGLYRMYFTNASTGERSYYEFDADTVVYGAEAALARLSNVQAYNWHHAGEKGSSGTAIGIEPVYVVRPHEPKKMYWKYTITNVRYSGISATAVMDSSKPDHIDLFKQRGDFEAWLDGKAVKTTAATPDDFKTKALEVIRRLRSEIDTLQSAIEQAK